MRSLIVTAALAGLLGVVTSARALPPIPNYLAETVAAKEDGKAFAEMYSKLEGKCSACHYPGKDKKVKGHALNDFGQAMHVHLDHKAFLAAHDARADKDAKTTAEAAKVFVAAWEKALADKNAGGQTYRELIKAGKLPGDNTVKE